MMISCLHIHPWKRFVVDLRQTMHLQKIEPFTTQILNRASLRPSRKKSPKRIAPTELPSRLAALSHSVKPQKILDLHASHCTHLSDDDFQKPIRIRSLAKSYKTRTSKSNACRRSSVTQQINSGKLDVSKNKCLHT